MGLSAGLGALGEGTGVRCGGGTWDWVWELDDLSSRPGRDEVVPEGSGLTDFREWKVPIQSWKRRVKTSRVTKPTRFFLEATASALRIISFIMRRASWDMWRSFEAESSKSVMQEAHLSGNQRCIWGSMQGACRRHKWPPHFSFLLVQFLHSPLELREVDREREDMAAGKSGQRW